MRKLNGIGALRNSIQKHSAPIPAILFLAAVAIIAPALSRPQQTATAAVVDLTFDPEKTQVRWTLDTTLHTVHGTFRLRSGNIHFDPATGKASGEIVVNAQSGESGNPGRDEKMHKEVLESSKYSDIVYRPDSAKGNFSGSDTWTLEVHGKFTLHGTEHEMTIPVQWKRDGQGWTSTSKFTIPFLTWGLKNPSNFVLRVKPDVEIELDGAGTVH